MVDLQASLQEPENEHNINVHSTTANQTVIFIIRSLNPITYDVLKL